MCLALNTSAKDDKSITVSDSVNLSTVVVTATRTPKTLANVPMITRVITADDIKKIDAVDIRDVLQQELPGIEFSYSMSQQVNLNMAGFGGNAVLFLVDGERLAGETLNNVDYSRLTMDNVERIEIIKGAASSLYGSNAVGGVINIITKKAKKKWSVNVNGHWGNYGEQRYGGVMGLNKGKFNSITNIEHMRVNSIKLKNGGDYSQVYGNRTWNFKEKLIYDLNDKSFLTGRAGYFFRERNSSFTDKDRYRDYNVGLKGFWKISDNDNLEVAYSFDQYDKSDFYIIKNKDIRDYSNVQNSVRVLYSHIFCKNTTLSFGSDFLRDYLMSYQFEKNGSYNQQSIDGFAQLDFNPIEKFNIIAGLRYDYFSGASMSRFSSKLGFMYHLSRFTFRGSYAGGFRAPTLKEMYMSYDMANIFMIYGDKDLKSETSNNFQLSTEYSKGNYTFQVTGFYNILDNRITTAWNIPLKGMKYVNMNHMQVYGINADVSAHWKNNFTTHLSYAFTKEDIRKGEPLVTSTRPHSITARIEYDKQWKNYGFNIALSGRYLSTLNTEEYTSSTSYEETEKVKYIDYSIWKLTLIQRVINGFNVTMAIDNVFNYIPKYYYNKSPSTTGSVFSIGVSIDLDNLF